MALQLALSLPAGIELPAAYARISSIAHTHLETIVHVQFWASAAARSADLTPVREQSYSLPWADSVSLTGAYTALKATPEFSAALDV